MSRKNDSSSCDSQSHETASLGPCGHGDLDLLDAAGVTEDRKPDNDADGIGNLFETTYGLNRDSRSDATIDHDGEGANSVPGNLRSFFVRVRVARN